MYCSNCGNKLEVGNKFCNNCGIKVDNSVSNANVNNDYVKEEVIKEEKVEVLNNSINNNIISNTNQISSNFNNNQINYNNNSYNYNRGNIYKKPNNKKSLIFLSILIAIVFIIALIIIINISGNLKNSSDKDKEVVDNYDYEEDYGSGNVLDLKKGTRTVLVYIIGSNLESEAGAATYDISEMVNSKYNNKDINLLIYAGGTKRWQNKVFESDENAIYEVSGSEVKEVKTYPIKNMTNPATLTEFIDYVYDNYESDLYDLILWDHGGGPIYGYGSDENVSNSKAMSLTDLNKALNDSKLIEKTKFEMIGFDACLMSSVEVAYALKEEANYFVASSEVEPGAGWDYNFLGEVDKDTTSEELGKLIVDYYNEYYNDLEAIYGYRVEFDVTLSLFDLRNINDLITGIDSLFSKLDSSITIDLYSKLSRKATRAVVYGYIEGETIQYDLVDLYDLVSGLEGYSSEVNAIKNGINKLVIYERGNIDNCYGISMYFPITTTAYYGQLQNSYEKVAVSSSYKKFLKSYTKISTGDRLVSSNLDSTEIVISENDISAVLPSDMVNGYQDAQYLVFRKMEDGSFLPIYLSRDVQLSGNTIKANVKNVRLSVGNKDGSEMEDAIAIEVERDANSVTYVLSSVLQKIYDEFDVQAVNIYVKVDNDTKKGEIISIKEIETTQGVADKNTVNLNDWDIMQFVSSSYFLYDQNGNKLDEWEKSGVMYGTEQNIKNGYVFEISEFDKKEEYYYMFRVRDTQGNYYESDLVKAK